MESLKIEGPYDPKKVEDKIYKLWEDSGFFNPDNLPGKRKKPFTIMMPPPNATGTLHIGHAFEDSIQDILIRYHRMKGEKTLWLPGTDHAAIATNTKVEKILMKEENKNRHEIGKEAFIKKVEEFVSASQGVIQKQIRKLGASPDWSREAFTFDTKRSLAVKKAFEMLYETGLIYIGERIVNWDPKGQTTVSDDEVVHKPEKGQLYTFKYSKDFPIAIATTRPETKVGDVAVDVHPDDKRYAQYIGKTYAVEFAGVSLNIKIITDESIDPAYGTGALGVTPAHSIIDYEIAQKNNLPSIQVINEYAKMTPVAGTLVEGKKTKEAREIIVQWLTENGLLEKTEMIDMNISAAERSGGIIEPLPKRHQWFIAVNKEFTLKKSKIKGIKNGATVTLKKLMKHVVESGQISIMPENREKIYYHWIENLRDWNISRQLWYGHKIPAYYKYVDPNNTYGEIDVHVGDNPPANNWKEFDDTLDTWFSSALWTFSTLGWPEENSDLKMFHPTQVMAPGYEILFFWVARMILMSTFLLGEVPFETVYLHGMVRDAKGNKFSKSLDNGVDPLEVIEQYGADALRMALVVGVGPGNDSKFDIMRVKGYKNFANKIWNASKFVLMNLENYDASAKPKLSIAQKATLKDLKKLQKEITKLMDEFKFYYAAEKIYHYFWHEFCDKIIEESKATTGEVGTQYMLLQILKANLKMLHPFMPFITEEIYQQLPIKNKKQLLMVEEWNTTD